MKIRLQLSSDFKAFWGIQKPKTKSALLKAKYVPTFVGLRGLKLPWLCSKQGTYFLSPFIGFDGGPLPPPLRRRRLWMAPNMKLFMEKIAHILYLYSQLS